MATYFITGISGLVGGNLVRAILANDPTALIVGLVWPNDPCRELDRSTVALVEGDILSPASLDDFLSMEGEGKRYLIHAAGKISVRRKDDLCFKVNVEGTRNVLEAAKRHNIDRFLCLSSVDALAKVAMGKKIYEQSSFPVEGLDGSYSKSKAIASTMVLEEKGKGMEVIVVHPSAILGPHDPGHNPIDDAIRRFLIGKLPAVVKGAYDLVDVRDVAEGILLLLEKGEDGECYLLTGNHKTVLELIGEAAKASGRKPVKATVPTFLVKIASPFIQLFASIRHKEPLFTSFAIDCLLQNSDYCHDKASRLGYAPRPLGKTMEDTIAWMNESGYLRR